ncbi:AraC family transcriptional regulator [Paenibacillus sp. ACRRX]|uniref:helix-turn-helix transcriptional regulator n=1 Tax=Paenibacillus sp. ACRRX TaxID=2918206 RepID=UPI001EF4FA77|nr:AraC family transcriptional regulator [Paenibacillus sp. ACRRX]MCG7407286.1 AraC family transcriptional regulator [Paenibacillus sp. ACRRX]
MPTIHLSAPPLPHFINSGHRIMPPGNKPPARRHIDLFQLIVVRQGCLYIGAEEQHYELSAQHALILLPNKYHFPTSVCQEETTYDWIHFQTKGCWTLTNTEHVPLQIDSATSNTQSTDTGLEYPDIPIFAQQFQLRLPQFSAIEQPDPFIAALNQLSSPLLNDHLTHNRWQQQLLFQQLLLQLASTGEAVGHSSASECAVLAATYLRDHYQDHITAELLGENINFHPVYIARCMQKQFGCSPFEYLQKYRIEQAKLLLLQTDDSIARVAALVGFNQAAYFTACFAKLEGISPRQYRQRFI